MFCKTLIHSKTKLLSTKAIWADMFFLSHFCSFFSFYLDLYISLWRWLLYSIYFKFSKYISEEEKLIPLSCTERSSLWGISLCCSCNLQSGPLKKFHLHSRFVLFPSLCTSLSTVRCPFSSPLSFSSPDSHFFCFLLHFSNMPILKIGLNKNIGFEFCNQRINFLTTVEFCRSKIGRVWNVNRGD